MLSKQATKELTEIKDRKPVELLDWLYKYGNPYTKIVITMGGLEVLTGECSLVSEIRD